MSNSDDAFIQATDNLLATYRTLERQTLDLPLVSFMPMLIFFWSVLKFCFFVLIGIPLIIPVNLVILIRNFFPGHWRYRPFFLPHIYYLWLWLWRGEAPTIPFILIRPLLSVFMKVHFERRLRRLKSEVALNDKVSDATRSMLLGRLDAALERWKAPRLAALFFTVLLPTIFGLPAYYKQLVEFLSSLDVSVPTEALIHYITTTASASLWITFFEASVPGYLVAIPVTAFLAKRGLFLNQIPDRICFPGGQGGIGVYAKEREILASIGIHMREVPWDLWFSLAALVIADTLDILTWDRVNALIQSFNPDVPTSLTQFDLTDFVVWWGLFAAAFVLAAVRRRKTGRF
jgi:hypothetical protein